MEKIEIDGDFITIREIIFNLNDLIFVKPQSLVSLISFFGGPPKETGRDFPKIIVQTKIERFEFAYTTDEMRNQALSELTEKIKIYQASKIIKQEKSNNISINVADSSNINIVNQSNSITITSKQIDDAKNVIEKIKQELQKLKETNEQEVDEIAEALIDIENKIEKKERIPRLTFKSFLQTCSNLSSIASLAITLGQIIEMIPIPK